MENLIYEKLQAVKRENVVFKEIQSLFKSTDDEKGLLEHFNNPNEVSFIEYNMSIYGSLDKAIIVTIPLKKSKYNSNWLRYRLHFIIIE